MLATECLRRPWLVPSLPPHPPATFWPPSGLHIPLQTVRFFDIFIGNLPIIYWTCLDGVLLLLINYTGDRLNFGLAAERARNEGIKVKYFLNILEE